MNGEVEAIGRTMGGPVTYAEISAGVAGLGVERGERLLVHASLSALGFVAGGAQVVVEGLKRAVGEGGLLAMPAFTSQLSDPVNWQAPPVPRDWWETIRSQAPAFDPASTPSRGIGAVSEALRTSAGAVRGDHPLNSLTAWGTGAEAVVGAHPVAAVARWSFSINRQQFLGVELTVGGYIGDLLQAAI